MSCNISDTMSILWKIRTVEAPVVPKMKPIPKNATDEQRKAASVADRCHDLPRRG